MPKTSAPLGVGDFVTYYHGMPVDTDYGVVLEARDGRFLCYDPFWGWEFHAELRKYGDLHGIDKISPDAIESTRTRWNPHQDGKQFLHTVAEAVAYAKSNDLFDRREKSRWWHAQGS